VGDDRQLEVGFVARAHGLRGEVVVELVTNRPERVAPGAVLGLADGRSLSVERSGRLGGPGGRDRFIVAFAGIADRPGADRLRALTLYAPPLEEDDTLWVHALIGAEVVDAAGVRRGRVEAVEENPASDLLVLDTGALVPLRFVVAHDAGRVTVETPEGLFDL
jgi:16S rRNA processing protein RimM